MIDAGEHVGLVHHVVIRYLRPRKHLEHLRDDLVTAGMSGLMAAAEKFDPERGVKFSSYACQAIYTHMIRYGVVPLASFTVAKRTTATNWDTYNEWNANHSCGGGDALLGLAVSDDQHRRACRREDYRLLHAAIQRLPASDRRILVRRFWHGVKLRDLYPDAHRETARKRIRSMIDRLREILTATTVAA